MNNNYQDEIRDAENAVTIATNVFNNCSEEFQEAAIYELLGAETRLKALKKESEERVKVGV